MNVCGISASVLMTLYTRGDDAACDHW